MLDKILEKSVFQKNTGNRFPENNGMNDGTAKYWEKDPLTGKWHRTIPRGLGLEDNPRALKEYALGLAIHAAMRTIKFD